MPQPPKHPHLKAVAGTSRPDRDNSDSGVQLPLVGECPEPPDWLPNAHAVNEWKRLAPILMAHGLLTEAGLSPFAHLCATHGKIVQLWSAGETPHAYLVAQLRNLSNDFGLTPIAQSKVAPQHPKGSGNPFDKNKRIETLECK
jgi:phage terminase small subunit